MRAQRPNGVLFRVQLYLTMRQRMKQKDPPQDETLTTFQRVAWILTLFD